MCLLEDTRVGTASAVFQTICLASCQAVGHVCLQCKTGDATAASDKGDVGHMSSRPLRLQMATFFILRLGSFYCASQDIRQGKNVMSQFNCKQKRFFPDSSNRKRVPLASCSPAFARTLSPTAEQPPSRPRQPNPGRRIYVSGND